MLTYDFKHFNQISAYYTFRSSLAKKLIDLMHFINANILGSQCAHSTNDLILLCRPEDDQLMGRNM